MGLDEDSVNGVYTYQLIADTLRSQIEAGEYAVDSQLPTQLALEHRFHVSRATVQRALKELRQTGYIRSVQGSGAYVLARNVPDPAASAGAYGVADVTLSRCLAEAFTAEHVRFDAYSLTAETINQTIPQELIRIRNGVIRPKSVTVRVLVADPDAELLIGQPLENPADTRPRQRMAALLRHQASILQHSFVSIHRLVPKVSVQVRVISATPVFKTYLLNGTELLHGYYQIGEQDVTVNEERQETVRAHDAYGLRSTLFHFSSAGAAEDSPPAVLVRHARDWFDSLWRTVAKRARLDG